MPKKYEGVCYSLFVPTAELFGFWQGLLLGANVGFWSVMGLDVPYGHITKSTGLIVTASAIAGKELSKVAAIYICDHLVTPAKYMPAAEPVSDIHETVNEALAEPATESDLIGKIAKNCTCT